MYKLYPNARRAHLKTGGNFPYLCRSAEVNLYIQVSLCIPTQSTNVYSWNSIRRLLFCACSCYLTCLSSVRSGSQITGQRWEQPHSWRAGFGGLSVACFLCPLSELLYSRAVISSSQKLLRRNVSLLPKPYASTPLSVLFSVSDRSIYCSSMVPVTQPSIPPWSAQKSWKSKRSVFTPAMSKKSSSFWRAGENEESVCWSSCVQSTVPTLPFSLC